MHISSLERAAELKRELHYLMQALDSIESIYVGCHNSTDLATWFRVAQNPKAFYAWADETFVPQIKAWLALRRGEIENELLLLGVTLHELEPLQFPSKAKPRPVE